MDRKNELEEKKKKLAQMRKAKEEQQQHTLRQISSTPSLTNTPEALNVDPDKILLELGITTPVVTSNTTLNNNSSANDSTMTTPNLQHQFTGQSKSIIRNKKQAKLTMNQVNVIDIPPKENVSYSKETQTPSTDIVLDKDAKPLDYYVLTYDNNDDDETGSLDGVSTSTGGGTSTQTNNKTKKNKNRTSNTNTDNDKNEQENDDTDKSVDQKTKVEISDEERQRLLDSDDFMNFFMRNTRILEKALDQDDIFFEYGASKKAETVEPGQAFKLSREFSDDRWRNRIVTWLDWSPHYPELLLASYEDSSLDSDGVALVWNTKFKSSSPEYIFNCSSWVTSCCFAKFHPNLVIAGTYSGQIVMWDNRSNKRTPIQRSSLSAASHTHPIHCIQVVGSQNAHNLISISNDGKLCSWTLDNMNTPQETLELQCKQARHVAVTTMGFRPGDVNNFIVGSEEGPVYTATRHGNKSGINEFFEGHFGPVTGLSCHHMPGPIDFSHIFLTTSFDWTVKLWNLKEPGKPLYSFENNSDYVYDVQWSPINPALFATVDGTGRLDLWNLINDSEVPTASLMVDGTPALNKVRWSNSGNQIAVGDDQGKISLFDINESYANPRADDWTKFVRVLQDLKQSSNEMNESVNPASTNMTSNTPVGSSSISNTNLIVNSSLGNTPTGSSPSVKSESNFDYRTGFVSPPSITQAFMSQLKTAPQTPK